MIRGAIGGLSPLCSAVGNKGADMLSTIYCVFDRFHRDGYAICRIAVLPFWRLLMQPPPPLSDHGLSWGWIGMASNN